MLRTGLAIKFVVHVGLRVLSKLIKSPSLKPKGYLDWQHPNCLFVTHGGGGGGGGGDMHNIHV